MFGATQDGAVHIPEPAPLFRLVTSDSSYNLVVSHKLPSPMILYVQSRLKMNLDRILVCRHKVQGSVQRLLYLEATEDAPYFT